MGNQLNTVLHGLHVGEVSQSALARVDLERSRLAAETQENVLPHVIGKGQFRPGTLYVGETTSSAKSRLLPFIKTNTDTALLECSASVLRVWISDTVLTRSSVTSTVTNGSFNIASATITVTIASPAVVTWTSHNRSADAPVSFATTGALPTGLTAGTVYYVVGASITANTFQVSATPGGAAINTSGSQSGTHTGYFGWGFTKSDPAAASATMSGGSLTLRALGRGARIYGEQAIETSSGGTEHALRVVVAQNEVLLRVGSSSGAEDYISETELGVGTHSLAFTPSGTYYVRITATRLEACVLDQVTVESSGAVSLPAPWSESDLPLLRITQSQDVVFMACASWRPRKIERRGTTGRSWSVVEYHANDGPFTSASTYGVQISSSASYGSVTLTASAPFFKSTHAGALIRLYPQNYDATYPLAGQNTYTNAFRVRGETSTGGETSFTQTCTGTWVGTARIEKSLDGEDTGFSKAYPSTVAAPFSSGSITSNAAGTGTSNSGTEIANVEHWYRTGFISGGYTSGVLNVRWQSIGSGSPGVYRITAYSSSTSVTADVVKAAGNTAATDNWQIGAWGDHASWPSAVALYDGRLFWGGIDKFWGSASDAYYTFTLDEDGDATSIQRSIATSGTTNIVRWFLPLGRLIIGTNGAEVSARSSNFDEPLTPTNVTLKDGSTHGAAAVAPVKIDNRGIYVHRDGTHLHEIVFDAEASDYRSNSLMLLNDTVGGSGLLELAVQRSPETYIWAVRADGQLLCFLYDPKEKAAAWTRCIIGVSAAGDAVVESVCVLPSSGADRVYMVVRRTINGGTKRYIEKLALHTEAVGGAVNRMLDSHVYAAGPVSSVTAAHLLNETGLKAWATDSNGVLTVLTGLSANGSGVISLGATYTNIVCGLGYSGRYKSAKLAYGAQKGTALLQPKRVARAGLLTENMHPNAITYGPDFNTQFQLPRVEGGQDVSTSTVRTTYDEAAFAFGGPWDTDARVCLTFTAPYPATVNALVIEMETNES